MGERKVTARRRAYEVVERDDPADRLGYWVHVGIVCLIVVSVLVAVLSTVPSQQVAHGRLFAIVEDVAAVVFIAELALRIWCAPEHPLYRERGAFAARLAYLATPGMVVDILAVVPFVISAFSSADLGALVVLRLIRFLKLARYSPAMRSLVSALYYERRALLGTAVLVFSLVLLSASFAYLLEREAQPDKFGTIPDAMWWAIVTLTTVGYGDVVPVTAAGKMLAGVTMMTGIMMLGIPVGIVASAFAREVKKRDFVVTWNMIAQMPLFADLDARGMAELIRIMTVHSADPGQMVLRRGDPADDMYFLSAGEVELETEGGTLALGKGRFFGDLAASAYSEHQCTARARDRCEFLVLGAEGFNHLIASQPDIADRIRRNADALYKRESAQGAGGPASG